MFRWFTRLAGAAILAVSLTGCPGDDDGVKTYTPDEAGVHECQADHPDKAQECAQALEQSRAEQEMSGPHFTFQQCYDQFGPSGCQARESGSYFVPVMAGFMFGVAVGSPVVYHPYYVTLSGDAYYHGTLLGAYRPGSTHVYITPARNSTWVSTYRVQTATVKIPTSTPHSPPSYNYGARPVEHGGLGTSGAISRAAAPTPPTALSRPPSFGGGLGGSRKTGR
jgi:uncharacterized protein YgiB involved in biofilm formation